MEGNNVTPKADSQLIELQGKAYLKVPGRIEKFREAHPNGVISTELISTEPRPPLSGRRQSRRHGSR